MGKAALSKYAPLMLATSLVLTWTSAAADPSSHPALPESSYKLASRPWAPLNIPKKRYLDVLEGLCRFSLKFQDHTGAIIDPYTHQEEQYSTIYFAYGVGTLVRAGRAKDLLPAGVAAFEHSSLQFAQGDSALPQHDGYGAFFMPALVESLDVYASLIPKAQLEAWRSRLQLPLRALIGARKNNWMTYAMKGEWLRATHGLASREDAQQAIEEDWRSEQRARILATPLNLYHDKTSDPDTLSVEAVGRGNLLALIADGYDGPSAADIRQAAENGTQTTLLLQDPTGQVPANGRTSDHTWVDIGYQLAFQVMANREWAAGNKALAGVYQHASELSFSSTARWKRADGDAAGSYFITKNHFDPALRVGYQDASLMSNYTGAFMFHLAEAYNARELTIPERPAPAEIGGYAIALDPAFDSVFANAGGMQVQLNLRGQIEKSSGNYWTTLGLVRFSRVGWDSRLGPADGALTATDGVSFAPEFLEDGKWLRMGSLSKRYRGTWKSEFVHPALVRGTVEFRPVSGATGPVFESHLWITPDGVYIESTKTSNDSTPWGVTWPLFKNDGTALDMQITSSAATTKYSDSGDTESFLAIGRGQSITSDGETLRSTFGDIQPVRVDSVDGINRTFVYPHNASQPATDSVQASFRRTSSGFTSDLGAVDGDIYIGRTVAGGFGSGLTLPSGVHLNFNRPSGFLVQIHNRVPTAIETDRNVTLTFKGRTLALVAHSPKRFKP